MHASPSPSGRFYSPFGRISRLTYIGRVLALTAVCVAIVAWTPGRNPLAGLVLLASVGLILAQVFKRSRDAGLHWLLVVPALLLLNGLAFLALAVWPTKTAQEE